MNTQNEDNNDFIEDNINFSEPFHYPDNEEVELEDMVKIRTAEMLLKFINYIIPAQNPRLVLIALAFASDIDLEYILHCKNTETDIANKLGVGKQTFNHQLKLIRKEFNLQHSVNKRHGVNKQTYANNFQKLK